MNKDTLQNRRYVIATIILSVIVVYIVRLFFLQIVETKYKEGADSNAFLRRTIHPPRGLIYDRNNKLLVYNKPAYDVSLIMREFVNVDTVAFCKVLNMDKAHFLDRINEIKDRKKNKGYSPYTPQQFIKQLSIEDIAELRQSLYKFPGVYIENRTLREYTYPNAAHVLGGIGEVSQQMIDNDNYYRAGDYAGRDGIEITYEKDLRGQKGVEILLRDAKGRIQGKYDGGRQDAEARAGKNLTLTIDIALQELGENLLQGKVGGIVAIEPATGEILALVSNPTFNPSMLVGRQRSANYQLLEQDPVKPLFNRATQAQYSPGSTFKILQALAGLQLGGINEHTHFVCNGTASQPIMCTHSHGSSISLLSAIEQSCNPYFWNVFRATIEKDGYGEKNVHFRHSYRQWVEAINSFGLGDRIPDSDINGQSTGFIPTENYYDRIYKSETGWRAMTIRSLGIGQGEILVTPLQLANAIAAVANQGYYISPHLNKADSMKTYIHRTAIDKEHFPIVFQGMKQVMENTRSGIVWKVPGIEVCGKTGTTQNPHGKDHALYVAFAPKSDPQIAIAVVVENAGFGASYAMPIANLMIEKYLKGDVVRIDQMERIMNTITNDNVTRY
ncbi:MAG: penicillin-binding protein 2 [Prevotellaceae bacterium]|jgi:penicillin-binding protein 2|nr:penicillin-binding protein 2 [Prevotellaceae bacterium]